jgi:hypothetical protein
MKEAMHSERLQCGSKTYFFDIRETKLGDKYLQITESRLLKEGGRRKSDVAIFKEHLEDFKRMLEQMAI